VLLAKMTLDEKIALIGGINDFYIQAIPRLGLPALCMSDGPLGVHDYGATTAYPVGILLAATWDTELARRTGMSMGKEVGDPARPPSGVYEDMIAPLQSYRIRGAIWYQGEGNTWRAYQYRTLLPVPTSVQSCSRTVASCRGS